MPGPSTAAESMKNLQRTVDAQIEPYVKHLLKAAADHKLRVPDSFSHADGIDRQSDYANSLIRKLEQLRDDKVLELKELGIDSIGFHRLVEQAERKDRLMALAASAVEKLPQAIVMAVVAGKNPWTQAASKADPTKGPEAGAIVGGLSNAAAAGAQQLFGQYAKSVMHGPDPYFTKPSTANTHPTMLEVLSALGPITWKKRLRLGYDASRGMDNAAAAAGATSTILTGTGMDHNKVVSLALSARATLQPMLFGTSASTANTKSDLRRGTQGAMLLLSRQNLPQSVAAIPQPILSLDSAGRAAVKAGQVLASPFGALFPPAWVNPYLGLPVPAMNRNRPAIVAPATTWSSYLGTLLYSLSGVFTGSGNGALNNALGSIPSGSNLTQAGQTALRAFYDYAASFVNTMSLTTGNALGAHLATPPRASAPGTAAASAKAAVPSSTPAIHRASPLATPLTAVVAPSITSTRRPAAADVDSAESVVIERF
ncbi:MAG: hypothetical protein JWQ11_4506 [Rhizobacter sp.]|nr:hypothetical protein [Rhizobacter sp.]